MVLEVDNKGAKDLTCNWSIRGRTQHVEVKQYFLRELKECGLIVVRWCSGSQMTADMYTKNLAGPLFDYHAQSFVGFDEYMQSKGDVKWVSEVDHSGVTHEGRVSDGLLGCRESDVMADEKFRQAYDIMESYAAEDLDMTSEFRNVGGAPPIEVGGLLFGGIVGAASDEMWDYEYLRVWGSIIELDT